MIHIQESWEIIKILVSETLINQQCIKICINEKKRHSRNLYVSTVSKKRNFLKVVLCKPKMNMEYMKMHRKDVILC